MRGRAILVAAAFGGLALAAPASAAPFTYCVHQGPVSCAGTDVGADLQLALGAAQAHPGPDTVRIGPGSFSGPFSYGGAPDNPVQVVGAGQDSTTLTAPADPDSVILRLADGSGQNHNSVSGIGVLLPTADDVEGLVLGGTASGVRVTARSGATAQAGVEMKGQSWFDQGEVRVGSEGTAIVAAVGVASHARVTASALSGAWGILAFGGGTLQVSQVELSASFTGLQTNNVDVSLENALARVTSANPYARGVLASDSGKVQVLGTTIVGVGGATGGEARGSAQGVSPTLQVYNTIVWGFATDLACTGGNGASLAAKYSRFATTNLQGCTSWVGTNGANTDAAPLFVDPTVTLPSPATDFRLLSTSPLIDRGAAWLVASSADLDGLTRVRDGDGDGALDIDMGAYEYQRRPPVAVATASPAATGAGAPIEFSATGSSDPDAGDALTYTWAFDDGWSSTGSKVLHAFAATGAHIATLTVTDPTGLAASATATVSVAPVPPPAVAVDTTPPTVSGLRLAPARFAVRRPATKAAGSVRGTTIRFKLSEAAKVRLRFERARPGRLSHGRCRRPTRRLRRRRPCIRHLLEGTLTRRGVPGANRFRFSGRIGRRALTTGRHRLVLTATDPAGNRSSKSRAGFTILAASSGAMADDSWKGRNTR